MSNDARVQEIARLIRQHTGMQNGCVETAARAIAPLIESARAEGERDMRERCAVVVKGRVYKDRYREWPGIIEGNRRADSEIVSAVDALAATLDALPLASGGDTKSDDNTDALAQPGSAPQERSEALLQGRNLPHLGSSESCSDDARVQIPQASAKSEATQGAGTAQPNGPPRPRGPLNFTPIG